MNPPTQVQFPAPEDVEAAFYEALAKGDAEALMPLWADDEDVVCIHPTGQRFSGLADIRESWRQILGASRLLIKAHRIAQWQSMLLATHQIVENLQLGQERAGPLLATHVYVRGPHGWRMVCRHCSAFVEPALQESRHRILH
jgi:ketosteroid isomerase-like protein